jgi:hypothetical protein
MGDVRQAPGPEETLKPQRNRRQGAGQVHDPFHVDASAPLTVERHFEAFSRI